VYDGLLVCPGPSMTSDLERFREYNGVVCVVNFHVLKKTKFERPYYLISLDTPYWAWGFLKQHADYDNITLVCQQPTNQYHWTWDYEGKKLYFAVNKKLNREHRLSPDLFPHLLNKGQTVWTGLHFLITQGCRTIFCAGFNNKPYEDGSHYGGGGSSVEISYKHAVQHWDNLIFPELQRLNITFHSDRFNHSAAQ